LINIAGARETGVAQVVTTVLKFVPLAIIGIVGLFYIEGGNFTPFAPAGDGFDCRSKPAA
jgi:APA family basic amino acid/polyamine antiporter